MYIYICVCVYVIYIQINPHTYKYIWTYSFLRTYEKERLAFMRSFELCTLGVWGHRNWDLKWSEVSHSLCRLHPLCLFGFGLQTRDDRGVITGILLKQSYITGAEAWARRAVEGQAERDFSSPHLMTSPREMERTSPHSSTISYGV